MPTINRLPDDSALQPAFAVVWSLIKTLKKSFLLSFAAFGLFLLLLAGTVFSSPETAGVVGASGLILFFTNIVGYLIYKAVARRF